MIKTINIILIMLLSTHWVWAQRMIPKQRGLGIDVGTFSQKNPGRNYFLSMEMTVNGKSGSYQIWGLEYTHEYAGYNDLRLPLETYTVSGGHSFQLLTDNRKNIALSVALIGIVGYETINRGKNTLYDGSVLLDKASFIYGAGGRLSLETYLCDRVILLVFGRAKMLWGTSLDQFRPSVGAGLRFNF